MILEVLFGFVLIPVALTGKSLTGCRKVKKWVSNPQTFGEVLAKMSSKLF